MSSSPIGKSIDEVQALLKEKKLSAQEVVAAHLEHIEKNDSKTHAFITVTKDLALNQAKAIDEKIARGEKLSPLAGIPVALKDNIAVAGSPNTCASKILENFVSPFTATAANNLFQAGAICVGKANLDEFAMGSSSENSAFEIPRNPWNLERVPGGSSGGPAVSVASGYSIIGIGSDTGGSIRLPASFCGIVGMKPTYGLVSRFGLVAFASSLDQIGPFARSVKDCAITLASLIGEDPWDSTSLKSPFKNQSNSLTKPDHEFACSLDESKVDQYLDGVKIGIISDFLDDAIDLEIREKIEKVKGFFSATGAQVEEVSIPHIKEALPVYYIVATAEASANLARFDGVRYGTRSKDADDITNLYNNSRQHGFGDEVKRRIMLGTYALSSGYYDAYYKKAQQVRRLIKESFDKTFANYDILLSPMAPSVAFKVGEKVDDPLTMYLTDIATLPANLAGIPGMSIPVGLNKEKMPIGVQLLAGQLNDAQLLKVGFALEHQVKKNLSDSLESCPMVAQAK